MERLNLKDLKQYCLWEMEQDIGVDFTLKSILEKTGQYNRDEFSFVVCVEKSIVMEICDDSGENSISLYSFDEFIEACNDWES